jgi:hypothetical protein
VRIFVAALIAIALARSTFASSTIDSTNANAWGANIGYTNWKPSPADGVVVGEFVCSGYIYGANVGWINVGNGDPINHIQYSNASAADFGVNYIVDSASPGQASLRGYAYGYAYSANCGWINLDDLNYFAQSDTIAPGVDTDGNGIADAWEYLYFGSLLGAAANQDPDGDGMTNLQEYLEGTDPASANDRLRITAYSTNAGGTSSLITWMSTVARLYAIETTTDLVSIPFADSGMGTFTPDAGVVTTRTVPAASAAKRFFRVRAIRPLP